jgi:hypothetical protein
MWVENKLKFICEKAIISVDTPFYGVDLLLSQKAAL